MVAKALSMQEGLQEIEVSIASMKMGPDPDQQFLSDLEQVIIAKAKAPGAVNPGASSGSVAGPGQGGAPQAGGMAGQPQGQPPQGSPQGPPDGMAAPGAPGGQQAQAMQQSGVMPRESSQSMDPDELRRLLLTRAGK